MNSNKTSFKKPEFIFQFAEAEMEDDQQIEEKIEDFQTQILGTRVKTTRNITINFNKNNNDKICSLTSMDSSQEANC